MIHGAGDLLISAAAGYWVLTQASNQKAQVKKLGQILGLIIILVSVVGIACKIYYLSGGQCPPGGKAMVCPFLSKSGSPSQ